MGSRQLFLGIVLLLMSLISCRQERPKSSVPDSLADLEEMVNPAYQINLDSVHQMIRSQLIAKKINTPWDSALVSYYWHNNNEFIWLNGSNGKAADSLLHWLENISRHGISPDIYPTSAIRKKLSQMRGLQLQGGNTMNRLLADVEYQLSAAYLSYVCRLKFGFLPPERRWNDSLARVPLKRCDTKFALAALDSLKVNPDAAFHWAQPVSPFYRRMQAELDHVRSLEVADTTDYYRNRLLVNMERARWQYALNRGSKYVIVNVAAFMLQAFDERADTVIEMRVCTGTPKNKTPLLSGRFYYMELNPYWNVPQMIIRKEIIPSYRRDTTYFTRNRMKVYDRRGIQVNPHSIKWSKYVDQGVPYTVKQDNRSENSLGRIIFRFPNSYDVYLHDTPSKGTFWRTNRGVSHGCVRLERALDFAFFLLKEPNKLLEDRIRLAMDIKPVSEEGKVLPRSTSYKELKHYSLKEYIPLFIDYQTVFLSIHNKLSYCEDIYNYDSSLLEAMNDFILKP